MTVARVAPIALSVPMMLVCSPIRVLTVFTIRKPDSTRAIADRTSRIVYRPLITLGSNWFPGRSAPSTATPRARSNAVTACAVSAAMRLSVTWISMSFGVSMPVAAAMPAWLIYARAKELKPADVLPSVRERPTTFSEVDPSLLVIVMASPTLNGCSVRSLDSITISPTPGKRPLATWNG